MEKPDLKNEVEKLVNSSELAAISMKGCSSNCHVYPTLIDPSSTKLDMAVNTEWKKTDDQKALFCFINLLLKGVANKSYAQIKEGNELFEVTVNMLAVYHLSDQSISNEALEVFASRNGVFNTYPFAREIVANLTGKMGIAPVLLPLFKPNSVEVKQQEQTPNT